MIVIITGLPALCFQDVLPEPPSRGRRPSASTRSAGNLGKLCSVHPIKGCLGPANCPGVCVWVLTKPRVCYHRETFVLLFEERADALV